MRTSNVRDDRPLAGPDPAAAPFREYRRAECATDRVLAGVTPHLMVTDPFYGVEYDPEWRQIGWTGARETGRVERGAASGNGLG